jgi:glutamate-ammonia-ligase adenylyltransferase
MTDIVQDRIRSAACESFAPELAARALQEIFSSGAVAPQEAGDGRFLSLLAELLAVSPPMLDSLRSHPEWIGWLCAYARNDVAGSARVRSFDHAWSAWLADHPATQPALDLLRGFKRRETLAIAFLDIGGLASFEDTVRSISNLADWTIGAALRICWDSLVREAPGDLNKQPEADGFAVFALGKLGGRELNYSSDVDLIFCRRPSEKEAERRFFTRLGERLIHALSRSGSDGFLYRVDMRLRPYGETGPLVPSISSLVSYYESWGEAWERQALIKARPVAGSSELCGRFRDFVDRFTFARQMDDSALEEIKRVKHRAEREHLHADSRMNIKQGPGGIRDIEFYAQYLQLIAGWRNPGARSPSTLGALRGLAQSRSLLEGEESTLSLAYLFQRIVEHRLQLRSLTPQTVLPRDAKELAFLAAGMGFGRQEDDSVRLFTRTLDDYRGKVRGILERIYLTPGYLRLREHEEEFARLLSERTPKERVRELLVQYGFEDIDKAWQNIRLMALGPEGRLLPPAERRAFLEFVFPLLEVLRDSIDPDTALHNLESFAAASGNRISFLRTLASRRPHLARLTNLLALSNRAHQILIRHPEYFDSLARGIHLQEGRSSIDMLKEIRERLGASPRGEGAGPVIRKFKQRELVRIAYRDLAGFADAIEVSSELSGLGEACTAAAVELTRPSELDFGRVYSEGLCVIGLGKLGSRLMHYASDLDLIFLYESPSPEASAEARARAQKMADERVERILELLSAVTADGVAYNIDLRLRPEGASGLLARSWDTFEDYARHHMEAWERLALVRSRVIQGTRGQFERWDEIKRRFVFRREWNQDDWEALLHLKRRIESEKNRESRIQLDFKYGKGGVVDLEFLTQWLQLRQGRENPQVRVSSLVEAIPALGVAGVLTPDESVAILQAYRFLRHLENRYQLMEEWTSREISRESPTLVRLARSMGYAGATPAAARQALVRAWDEQARAVRGLVERFVFGSANPGSQQGGPNG